MVGKGLATVVRYRQDDDQRSSRYDELLTAEAQAVKGTKGVHSKKEGQSHRINDLTVDHSRIKQQYLPSWQRALRTEAIVEFIASGSRFRVYIPKDSCLVTFLLGGITCPRSSRPSVNGIPAQEAEPYGDEALAYVRDRVSVFFNFFLSFRLIRSRVSRSEHHMESANYFPINGIIRVTPVVEQLKRSTIPMRLF